MKLSNAIKKLEKASETPIEKKGQEYSGLINGYIVSFFQNGREDEATCYHVRRIGDESNIQIDYFAGWYCDNLGKAIKSAQQ